MRLTERASRLLKPARQCQKRKLSFLYWQKNPLGGRPSLIMCQQNSSYPNIVKTFLICAKLKRSQLISAYTCLTLQLFHYKATQGFLETLDKKEVWQALLFCKYLRVDKISLKMPKMVSFGDFFKTWSLQSNSVTRQVNFDRTKISENAIVKKLKCDIFDHFKQCEVSTE